jgi:hypothetical protein
MSGVLLGLKQFGDPIAEDDEVYSLTRVDQYNYSGLGYVNVFDGSAAPHIEPQTQPGFGIGAGLADLTLACTIKLDENVWDNPNWQMGSSDPMRFNVGTPEPATMLLLGMGAGLLGVIRRRRS